MKKLLFVLFMCDFLTVAYSQTFTLNDCMQYAIEKNQSVKRQQYTNENYRQDYIQSIATMLPDLSVNSGLSANYGRSIDPKTNTYTTTGNLGNSYSLYGEIPLFAGFQHINTVRVNKVMRLMGVEKLQQTKDDIAIKTMQSYFDVVYFTNGVKITEDQLKTSRTTLEQSRKMYELGRKSLADVAQVESQVASDELLLVQQKNKLALAELALKQQMNYPIKETLVIDTDIDAGLDFLIANGVFEDTTVQGGELAAGTVGDLVDFALANNPKMKASRYNVRQTQLNLYVTQGRYVPQIYGNGGFSTNYYKELSGENIAAREQAKFFSQLTDNRGYYFGASISIPIFRGLSRRTAVHKAKNAYKIAQEDNSETELAVKTEVTQAVLEMRGFEKEYEQATKKVVASQLAHEASLNKYKQGLISPIDLQTTSNQLLMAKSEQLNAHLQFLVKSRLVDYYSGEPLVK
ncbi:MAG: TolC family protein [Bacteroidales bacterium]